MDNNKKIEFQIGVLVLAAIGALVALTIYFSKGSTMNLGDEYTVCVRFSRSPGISRNSPVFKNGVRIGRVSKVELIDQDREVEISILLPKTRKIYTDEECRIRQTVIMGDASLEFVKKLNYIGPVKEIDPDEPQVGAMGGDLLSGFTSMEGDMTKALHNVSTAATDFSDVAGQVGDFFDRVNAFIGSPEEMAQKRAEFETILKEMRTTMQTFQQFTAKADGFINDPEIQANVRKVTTEMPGVVERSKTLIDNSNLFVGDARQLVERTRLSLDRIDASLETAQVTLDGVREITDQVRGDVPEITASLKKASKSLESLFDELTMIVRNFRDSDGSLKRLIRDPALYEKVYEMVDNLERLSAEVHWMLRTDVKPITDNVKILTDKAARDPSIFLRNLLRKQPQTKGMLPQWGDGLGSDSMALYSCNMKNGRPVSTYFPMETLTPSEFAPIRTEGRTIESVPPAPRLAPDWDMEIETDDQTLPPQAGRLEKATKKNFHFSFPVPVIGLFSRGNTEVEPPATVKKTGLLPIRLPQRAVPAVQETEENAAVEIINVSHRAEPKKMPALRFTRKP